MIRLCTIEDLTAGDICREALTAKVVMPTLIVRWDQAHGAMWALRLFEYAGQGDERWDYPPPAHWRRDNGRWMYRDHPIAAGDGVPGRAQAHVQVDGDALSFEVTLRNDAASTWQDAWCWVCLIHRWAPAFGANCELPVGKDGAWSPCAALDAPMGRWLKWCPVAARRDEAERIGRHQSHMWQPHLEAGQTAVRAWRMKLGEPTRQFAELSSPDAFILGWSHWPCTDMGMLFGDIEPGGCATVSGRLAMHEESYETC